MNSPDLSNGLQRNQPLVAAAVASVLPNEVRVCTRRCLKTVLFRSVPSRGCDRDGEGREKPTLLGLVNDKGGSSSPPERRNEN